MSNNENLKNIILNSELSGEDKKKWQIFIDNVSENEINPIADLLEEDPSGLLVMNKNLQDKLALLSNENQEKTGEIIKEEEKIIGGL